METIAEQREWVKKLRGNIPSWEKEHEDFMKREEEEFKEKIRRSNSYHNQFMMVVREQLKKEEKRLAEMLSKFCESCGGEVELQSLTGSPVHQNTKYKCKICGNIQSEYKEF
jgi:hypothetical protein